MITLFDIITHASYTNVSAIPKPYKLESKHQPQSVTLGLRSIDNVTRDIEKFLLDTQVSTNFA